MDNKKMGQLISELRKMQQMTQKDLALKLHVSDKAVSKWERGLSCPDASLLSPLSDILGITISELLKGERNSEEVINNPDESISNALQYAHTAAKSKVKSIQTVFSAVFSIMLVLGIITCAICDLAISGSFSWSLIPISACVFAWFLFTPSIKFGIKGIVVSLAALSILILPFLLVLNSLIDSNGLLMPIGIRVSVISTAYLWSAFIIFKILKSRKLIALAVSLLLSIPCSLMINFVLSKIISSSLFDVWDAMSIAIITGLIIFLFIMDYCVRKRKGT
ncbi:MAG: helix-turn-helix domain-containing protein [Oscillospiraceae bacterium]|nr:helix-turn-helix domain-containing protein [Oscillospiraceae bacterium]